VIRAPSQTAVKHPVKRPNPLDLLQTSSSDKVGRALMANTPSASIVWVAHSSGSVAAQVVETLQRLDLDVRLWEAGSSLGQELHGLVVADSASLRTMARSFHGKAADAPMNPTWRGGLAPYVLQRVKAHIEDTLSDKIELGELARIAELSECHFSRAFRQSIGVPPHRYIVSRRVAIAAQLVKHTDRALTDIALVVGFSDHSHFTRSFVRITGETPRGYRRRHR
jgi:AraC-like DNA-binding protein